MKKELFNDKISSMKNYIMFEIKAKQIELTPNLKAKNRSPIALSMGAPVEAVSPFIIQKTKEYLDIPSLHTYSTPKGEPYFLEACAYRMKHRFGVEINPKNEVCSLIGSKEGICHMIKALVNPDREDVIMVPSPGYASYSQMIKSTGAKAFEVKLTKENNFQPNLFETLEDYKKQGLDVSKIKALIVNYPNNPLGCTCSFEYLQHCVDFANELGILLISDNAYCDMYFDGNFKPHSALECKGAMDCCIEMYSFSKSYAMTGWRLGWACGNKDAVMMLSRMKSTVDTGIFKVLQYAGADILKSSEGDDYIEEQNKKFENKLKVFTNGLKSLGYNIEMPKATFYLWLEIPKRFSSCVEFANELLEKSGIVIVPGTAFDKKADRFCRISVVAKDEDLIEVIERMKKDGFQYE
ncbi:aminotransferase class I/II-fold pyridoxal phosphate-dependent enzyme [bacterium]|nr:aminotransferase class I/II-fold pyridoxal phosphate-dependent enzyme [bacterium]